jgi:hypothetical protein
MHSAAASMFASLGWRLARACGLTVDDGDLGSAARLIRQVSCPDLQPLPLSERILPFTAEEALALAPGRAAEAAALPAAAAGAPPAVSPSAAAGAAAAAASAAAATLVSPRAALKPIGSAASDSSADARAGGWGLDEGSTSTVTASLLPAQRLVSSTAAACDACGALRAVPAPRGQTITAA